MFVMLCLLVIILPPCRLRVASPYTLVSSFSLSGNIVELCTQKLSVLAFQTAAPAAEVLTLGQKEAKFISAVAVLSSFLY